MAPERLHKFQRLSTHTVYNSLILKVMHGSGYRTPLQSLEKLNRPCLLFPTLILCYITSQELHVH